MEFLTIIGEVGFPIAGAIAAGYFVFLTIKFILAGVTGGVISLKNIITALDNRVQTMNNDLVQIDAKMSHVLGVKPNVERLAANEGKEDARRD
jgi:uncharacterized membrane protein YozB (DUF420 family)|tara:strand:- start:3434 stop:3712 length:279 start_codon:yes stop_codon:yes gene_type:complete